MRSIVQSENAVATRSVFKTIAVSRVPSQSFPSTSLPDNDVQSAVSVDPLKKQTRNLTVEFVGTSVCTCIERSSAKSSMCLCRRLLHPGVKGTSSLF